MSLKWTRPCSGAGHKRPMAGLLEFTESHCATGGSGHSPGGTPTLARTCRGPTGLPDTALSPSPGPRALSAGPPSPYRSPQNTQQSSSCCHGRQPCHPLGSGLLSRGQRGCLQAHSHPACLSRPCQHPPPTAKQPGRASALWRWEPELGAAAPHAVCPCWEPGTHRLPGRSGRHVREQQEYVRTLTMSVKALPSGGLVMKTLWPHRKTTRATPTQTVGIT